MDFSWNFYDPSIGFTGSPTRVTVHVIRDWLAIGVAFWSEKNMVHWGTVLRPNPPTHPPSQPRLHRHPLNSPIFCSPLHSNIFAMFPIKFYFWFKKFKKCWIVMWITHSHVREKGKKWRTPVTCKRDEKWENMNFDCFRTIKLLLIIYFISCNNFPA